MDHTSVHLYAGATTRIHGSTTAVHPCSLALVLLPPPMAAHAGALAPPLLPLPPCPLLHPRLPNANTTLSSLRLRGPRLAVARAASGGNGGGPPAEADEEERGGRPSLPALSDIRWRDLLSPEPANATAVVLTGALAWAGASLLLQLALIFFSIFAAAIKYSFVAAFLIFVLIALL